MLRKSYTGVEQRAARQKAAAQRDFLYHIIQRSEVKATVSLANTASNVASETKKLLTALEKRIKKIGVRKESRGQVDEYCPL